MTSLNHYQTLVESIFGVATATFDTTKSGNNVTGALARQDDNFQIFRANFEARLRRLNTAFSVNSNRDALLRAVNEVADPKNWEGAYAELAGLDFLLSCQDYSSDVNLDVTLPAKDSIAAEFGKQNTNLDVCLIEFETYLDIKCLSDKSRTILDGITSDAIKQANATDMMILPEYPLDMNYETFAKARQNLVNELSSHLSADQKSKYFKSSVVDQLTYRILRDSGVAMAASECDPYNQAENHHNLIFQHVKKLLKQKPTLLLYVHFPWFSEQHLSAFDSDQIFYRSVARRFFCQYAKDDRPLSSLVKGCIGEISIAETTKHLSGILFINDLSIEKDEIKGFAYLNPNGTNKVSRRFRELLGSLGCTMDDFEHDNY